MYFGHEWEGLDKFSLLLGAFFPKPKRLDALPKTSNPHVRVLVVSNRLTY